VKKSKKLTLAVEWNFYCKLWAEGDKLRAEGDKLRAEGDKLRAEGDKLRAEGDKLRAEGDKLRAEGDKLRAEGGKLRAEGGKLWADKILSAFGNIKIEWKYVSGGYDCELENGDVYKFKKVKVTLKSAMKSLENVTPLFKR
jgi:cell division protein FtsB